MTNRIFLAAVLVAGCGGSAADSDGGSNPDFAARGDANAPDLSPALDMTPNNPQNPAGLGPKAIEIGAASNLAAPGSYAILAKTGIMNATGSLITGGNIAVSPASYAAITGFALMPQVPSAATVSSTSVSVAAPGMVYASDYAIPSPTNLTTAVLAMEAAYTDAAGRSPPDHLDLKSGDLSGLVLAPGLYTWGSAVTIPADVTITGGANDTWIFQISKDLDVSTAKKVLLGGNAQAKNIFWQVAGKVTIHANAHFEGIILSKTAITLQTTATMHGRAYAQSAVALDNNALTVP